MAILKIFNLFLLFIPMRHFADLLLNKNNSKANDQVPFIQRRRGIEIKSAREINLMKKSSRIVATVLRAIMVFLLVFVQVLIMRLSMEFQIKIKLLKMVT